MKSDAIFVWAGAHVSDSLFQLLATSKIRRKSFVRFLIFASALLVAHETLAAVGRTVGSFNVSATGEAQYTIPLFTPAGSAQLTPPFELVYGHRSPDGYFGVGWNLTGLSALTRCRSTWAQNGVGRDIRNDLSDRFCLDGSQLRLVGGTHGVAGSEYRTEIESFSRITAYGSAGNGPAYFIVERKDGLIYEYGNSADSRIESLGQSTSVTWALNKIRDRAGNEVLFNYTEDATNGSYRINNIQYTRNPGAGLATAPYTVTFVYEDVPAGEVEAPYAAGSKIKRIKRVDRIDVTYNTSTLVRRYELTYEAGLSNTYKSRLSSVQECAGPTVDCLSPTTISYQAGTVGLDAEVTTGFTVPLINNFWSIDVNGDGRKDLVYSSHATAGSGVWMVALASASGGYATPASTGVTNTNYTGAIPIDYNSDGREDLLIPNYSGSTWWVMLGNSSGLASPANTGTPTTATGTGLNAIAADIDGDGRHDLVWLDKIGYAGGDAIRYRLQLSTGGFSSTAVVYIGPMPVNSLINDAFYAGASRTTSIRSPDFNGDGRTDIIYRWTEREQDDPGVWSFYTFLGTQVSGGAASGYSAETATTPQFGDFNGDAHTDVLYRSAGNTKIRLSTGTSFTTEIAGPLGSQYATPTIVLDWDGDGFDDVLMRNISTGNLDWFRSTGEAFAAPASTGISSALTLAGFSIGDINGDAQQDLAYRTSTGSWRYRLRSGVIPDLASSITDGFGIGTTFSYTSLANYANYTKYSTAVFPQQDVVGPITVVTNVQASNGIGGSYNLQSFVYEGARIDLQGRGFLGFAKRSWADSRNGLVREITSRQDFPFTGSTTNTQIRQAGGTLISETQSVFASHTYGAGYETRVLPYVSQTSQTDREVGGTFNGSIVRTATTNVTVDSATGTAYDSTVTVQEASTGNGNDPTHSSTQREYTPLANLFNDTANWCIGRPGQTQQINSHTLYGGSQLTRTTNTSWNGAYCRPTQTVIEPGNATLQVTIDTGYDAFGNVNSQTVTGKKPDGSSMPARTTTAGWGATGQFPVSVTNALSQTLTATYNYHDGTRASVTDANGVSIAWLYDSFGRQTRENRADSTATTTSYNDCSAYSCISGNNKVITIVTQLDTAGGYVNDAWTYLDRLGRPIASSTRTLSGAYDRVDREYDALGRVYRESAPCTWSSCTSYWTTFTYDLLDRTSTASRPRTDSDPTLQSTSFYYEGLTSRIVDAQGKETRRIASALGQLRVSYDHNLYYQVFDYDPFGNPIRVQNSLGELLQSSTYNIRGMLTQRVDMDMGTWSYVPNSLGEVVTQTNAKSQTHTYTFDLLGRPLTRVETEGTTTWTWGTSFAAKNIGKLESIVGPGGIGESYLFDSIGRPSQTTYNMNADGSYPVNVDYNNIGSLNTVTYPQSTTSCRLAVQYGYQYGQHKTITNVSNPAQCGTNGQVYWNATGNNARNQITQETLGNGLLVNRTFDAVTSWVKSIQSGVGGGTGVQNLAYQWDLVGNLSSRQDVSQSLTETFAYDNLYRLDYSQLNGVTNLNVDYDVRGNITYKSDVGTYTYHATKKHTLVSTSNGWSFTHDANGNMSAGRGNALTWNSYNYVTQILNGSLYSQFTYGPHRNYVKQVSNYSNGVSSTQYIGGILEKAWDGSVLDFRHFIRAGGSTVIVSRATNGANNTYYVTQDHLGSSSAVTNNAGAVLINSSFGAYGARRGSNWQGSPSIADWTAIANTSRHGFTDHIMLDNLSFIHMNGRVQDPLVGRFVSADPFIDGVDNTQGWNRFAYVKNRPLTLTDPSGFAAAQDNTHHQNAPPPPVTGSRIPGGGTTGSVSCSGSCLLFSVVYEGKYEEFLEWRDKLIKTIDEVMSNPDLSPEGRIEISELTQEQLVDLGVISLDRAIAREAGGKWINYRQFHDVSLDENGMTQISVIAFKPRFIQDSFGQNLTGAVGEILGINRWICWFERCSSGEAAKEVGWAALEIIPAVRGARAARGPMKSLGGSIDDAAAKARTQPHRPDTVSTHARKRMESRGVSYDSVQEAIRNGTRTFDPATGKAVYDLPASASSTGRAVRVIRNDVTGNIVSVIDRGSP